MARKTKATALAVETLRNTAATSNPSPEADAAASKLSKRRSPSLNVAPAPAPATAAEATNDRPSPDIAGKPIAGKLGIIASAVTRPVGATLDELTAVTGWQPHTVRAAVTRLRQRGIDARLTTVDDRKAYRVAAVEH